MLEKINRNEAFRVAMRLTGTRDKADDLVQAAFVKALENREKFREGSNERAWFYRLMKNHYINEWRRNGLASRVVASGDMPGWGADHAVPHGDATACHEVLARVASLPDAMRQVVELRAAEYEYAEIAEALAIPVGTVMSRLFRARALLAS